MGKKWTKKDDAFLMMHHNVGVSFIAEHDLSRSAKSARDRLKKLTHTGARKHWILSQIHQLEYEWYAHPPKGEEQIEFWQDAMRFWVGERESLERPPTGEMGNVVSFRTQKEVQDEG